MKAAIAKSWNMYDWPDGQRSYPVVELASSTSAFSFGSSAVLNDGIAEAAFYLELKARGDIFEARDYSTTDGKSESQIIAEMNGDLAGGSQIPSNPYVEYDASEDAAVNIFPSDTSTVGGNSLKLDHTAMALTGDAMWIWEAKWETGFNAAAEDWNIHKTFVIRTESPAQRMFEVRNRYLQSSDNEAGRIDVRGYPGEGWAPVNGINGADQIIGGVYTYDIPEDTWVRYFVYADYDGGSLSMWVHDELDTTFQIMDEIGCTFSEGPDQLGLQYNSSQGRSGANTVHAWLKHIVILRDLTDEPADIVAASTWP